jgi:uncharacterized damage-inducible protein DinB
VIPTDQFRRLFEYEQDAHARVLESLRLAVPHYQADADFIRAIDLAAHIVTCRAMWLTRIRGGIGLPSTLFPTGWSLIDLEREFARTEQEWRACLATIDRNELVRCVEYVSYEGRTFRSSVHDILVQLFGHSLYHRGQIALLLRRMGASPAATDFIFWSRTGELGL